MRKIRLDPEALRVDSFATGAARADLGTVYGYASKPGTCAASCFGTCVTNCDCSLGCPSIAPCTEPSG
ncbi:hypothetical protein [Longimicrobium sp.]|uniref:hypothetical protein n=1 Tax=Longimicrobium sp. TaxID=2029185 RepID=UPI002C8BEFD2|nr:hypothetical protein [Longimicrobium sp.]HSU14941.1 hypothetical protein [Longimicrobium sp.]